MRESYHMAADDHEIDDILEHARQKLETESESAIPCKAILSKSSSQQNKQGCECSGRPDETEKTWLQRMRMEPVDTLIFVTNHVILKS